MTLNGRYALYCRKDASFGAHWTNLNEDRSIPSATKRQKCRPFTLVPGNIRCMRIFAGVPLSGGVGGVALITVPIITDRDAAITKNTGKNRNHVVISFLADRTAACIAAEFTGYHSNNWASYYTRWSKNSLLNCNNFDYFQPIFIIFGECTIYTIGNLQPEDIQLAHLHRVQKKRGNSFLCIASTNVDN